MIGKTISHYRILGQVGEGGMGVVYVAEDTVLGRRVAIKIPHAGRDESHYRARFLREARAVSKLRHPNIAAVHDYGETDDGQPFIVMELVSGQTLGDLLAGPGISVARAVEVACQTAEALGEAHRHGVVHRDIKPSNIIIDERGEVKVLDFGLAKQLHGELAGAGGAEAQTLLSARTRSDVVIGTPLYLSPEQARGSKVDGRSDLFALGALLYECVAGRPAFSGSNVIEIGAQVLHFDPPPPSRFNPRVPAELDRVTLKALAKRPEDRFQTAEEFARELERVRSRLPDSDTTRTRRIVTTENGHRSSALITMAEGLRRPKFSPLTLLASLAALLVGIWLVQYMLRPRVHVPDAPVLALYSQGVDAMREGAYYRASELLDRAVKQDKDFVLAHARLAEALMEMDYLDRAKDEMLAANTLAPDFRVFPREEALYLEAVRAAVMQEYAAAVRGHQEIVKLKPDEPQAHLDLGRAYERNYQLKEAAQSYTQATVRGPSYAFAFLRLGILHVRQGNTSGAVAAFESAQRLYEARGDKEGQSAVHYQRGRLSLNLGKPEDARPEFEQARQLAVEANNRYQQVLALLQLAPLQANGEEARAVAQSAIDLAQASGMNDQLANAYVTLGGVLFAKLNDYAGAENAYKHALQIASNFKLKRYEAVAYSNLSSLYNKLSRLDEAEDYLARARDFYIQAGYRREADSCAIVLGRIKKQKGDYDGALAVFEELLRAAEQAGEMGQAGSIHRECGAVLAAQEKYPQALPHFQDSLAAGHAFHNPSLVTYSLLSRANALWPLGRYEEATQLLRELEAADPQTLGGGKEVLVFLYNAEAGMALSRRNYAEAAAKSGQALALLKEGGAQTNDQLSWIDSDLGLAESFTGSPARGRSMCEEGVRLALLGNEPTTLVHAHYALALALLRAGDPAGARDAALRAQEISTRLGRAESEWRALAVAGKASRLAGDETAAREYSSRAAVSLAQLEQSLGADAVSYRSRPDVQWLRSEFGVSAANATH